LRPNNDLIVEPMQLTVLSVAFPFATVSPDSVGGAEQVLSALDHALVAAGQHSTVIAQEGSRVAGELIPMPRPEGISSEIVREEIWARYRAEINRIQSMGKIDVIHCHGIDYNRYLPRPGTPLLATLHLPIEWYAPEALAPRRPRTWLNGVSTVQRLAGQHVLPPIENGVPVERLSTRLRKRHFALMLSRICAEKGVHLAIEAAKKADFPLLIAGQVFAYGPHLRYFDEEVRPRLDHQRRLIGPISFARKRRLLTAARCLLVPSVVAETSSLVAREAQACGTPVIAFPNGALTQVIEPGRTGFLVDSVEAMASAIHDCCGLDPQLCRDAARARFSDRGMIRDYFAHYEYLTQRGHDHIAT
jgi:glycosyltransferase involved in cell wall biosynthesis